MPTTETPNAHYQTLSFKHNPLIHAQQPQLLKPPHHHRPSKPPQNPKTLKHKALVSVWAANRQLLGPAELAVMFHQLARVADPSKISLKALEMSKVRAALVPHWRCILGRGWGVEGGSEGVCSVFVCLRMGASVALTIQCS